MVLIKYSGNVYKWIIITIQWTLHVTFMVLGLFVPGQLVDGRFV